MIYSSTPETTLPVLVCVDVVLFTIMQDSLQVLLVQRQHDPCIGKWALPGGFVDAGEELQAAAIRELREETGISRVYLEQLYTFGRPDRDPRGRIISVAYYALAPMQLPIVRAGSDAVQARWFAVSVCPSLAFDHNEILNMAQQRLAAKLEYSTIAFQFMERQFTLSHLQRVYEIISGQPLDNRNFRRRICALPFVHDTGCITDRTGARPARLYTVEQPSRVEFIR